MTPDRNKPISIRCGSNGKYENIVLQLVQLNLFIKAVTILLVNPRRYKHTFVNRIWHQIEEPIPHTFHIAWAVRIIRPRKYDDITVRSLCPANQAAIRGHSLRRIGGGREIEVEDVDV
jgi:hypothetical protein